MSKILSIGIFASDGFGKGKALILEEESIKISQEKINNLDEEVKNLDSSLLNSIEQIKKLKNDVASSIGKDKAEIFDAHIEMLKDPVVIGEIKKNIIDNSQSALFSLDLIFNKYIDMFSSMDDSYMKERAADLKDVLKRISYTLAGKKITNFSEINEDTIIVAEDLTPSQTSQLNPKFIKGFITKIGGKTSHSAIMARTLNIPAIVGYGSKINEIKDNDLILIDGSNKKIILNPNSKDLSMFKKREENFIKFKKELIAYKNKKTKTKDGCELKIASNIGHPNDMDLVLDNGSEGIGLFRSEFLYMDSQNWPTEDEQFESYKTVLEKSKNDFVIIRTLDIGGDKILSYYKFPEELNPFLGYRAVRFCLDNLKIFKTQLRALYRASVYGKLGINVPMISTFDELNQVLKVIDEVKKELKAENKSFSSDTKFGIMIETPSIVFLMDRFAKSNKIDFFSVGTNDLIQYMYAADRMSEKVSYLYQPFNPSTLRALNIILTESSKNEKFSAICGELASETKLVPILVGMGVNELSVNPNSILKIRSLISKLVKFDLEALVKEVLNLETEKQVIDKIDKFFNKNSLSFYL